MPVKISNAELQVRDLFRELTGPVFALPLPHRDIYSHTGPHNLETQPLPGDPLGIVKDSQPLPPQSDLDHWFNDDGMKPNPR